MRTEERVVVVGLGEVGLPLLDLLRSRFDAFGVDVDSPTYDGPAVAVMHVCYPFEIDDFVEETARYMEQFDPRLTVINSTVGVGTTRAVHERTGARVVHSPVRGKHSRMRDELARYTKYVGGIDGGSAMEAATHFTAVGMATKVLDSPEATELAKLSETTYFGLLIAWAQEVSRYCEQLGLDYDEVVSFYDEIDFFPPVKYFPGEIGGHCVMPNIEILSRVDNSDLLRAIKSSNDRRIENERRHARADLAAEARRS